MKKLLFTLFVSLVALGVNAQSYEKSVEAGGFIGIDDYSKYSIDISTVHGLKFTDNLFAGIGLGFRYTDALYYKGNVGSVVADSYDGKYLIPVFARLKYNLTNNSISPFLAGSIGYTIDVGQNEIKNTEGLFYEPAFGVDFNNENNTSIYVMAGFNSQSTRYEYYTLPESTTEKGFANSVSIRVGFRF